MDSSKLKRVLAGLAIAGLVGGAGVSLSGCATTKGAKAETGEAEKAKSDSSHEKDKNATGSHGGSS